MEQRQIDWIIQKRDPGYRNSRLQDVKSHFDMMVRGAEFAFDRSFLSGQTHEAANKTRASKIAEIQKERQDQIDRIETDYSKDKARQETRRASLPKEISALNQQLGAANQAVNDCQKRLAIAQRTQMDEVLITQLLTALINQTQLEEWERGLPEERKAAAEKKKAREPIAAAKRRRAGKQEELKKKQNKCMTPRPQPLAQQSWRASLVAPLAAQSVEAVRVAVALRRQAEAHTRRQKVDAAAACAASPGGAR